MFENVFENIHFSDSIRVHSHKTYLLLLFSTDFDKRGLKLKLIQLSKTFRAKFLNLVLVFEKFTKKKFFGNVHFSIRKGALMKKISPSFLNRFWQTIVQLKLKPLSKTSWASFLNFLLFLRNLWKRLWKYPFFNPVAVARKGEITKI